MLFCQSPYELVSDEKEGQFCGIFPYKAALLMAWMPPPTGIVVCHCDVLESITQRESIHVRC